MTVRQYIESGAERRCYSESYRKVPKSTMTM